MDSASPPTFERPEIEHLDYFDLTKFLQDDSDVETSVDVLEIWRVQDTGLTVDGFEHQDRRNLPHVALVDHLSTGADEASRAQPVLRILFLKSVPLQTKRKGIAASIDDTQVALNKLTIEYLITSHGVCPLFLSSITSVPWVLDTGNALFKSFNSKDQELNSLQGFFYCSDSGKPVRVWFKHNLPQRSSTYIIHGCPARVETTIRQWAINPQSRESILRPLAIDSLIIDDVTWAWSKAFVESATKLLAYEHFTRKENMDRIDSAVQSLHNLSQHFHILQEELDRVVEQLDYLIDVHQLVSSNLPTAPTASVADSLRLLRSRTHKWHRCVTNWKERTQIRIDLFFNLSAQRDNLTNVNIARLTSEIAKATYRDSSSMITIAVLTLFFLPGTFVSGIFSMPFNESLVTRPGAGWQLYAAITVPLTFCVILAWNSWRQYRDKREPKLVGMDRPDDQQRPINEPRELVHDREHPNQTTTRDTRSSIESGSTSPGEDKGSLLNDQMHILHRLDDHQTQLGIQIAPRTPPTPHRLLSSSPISPTHDLGRQPSLEEVDSRAASPAADSFDHTNTDDLSRGSSRSSSRKRANTKEEAPARSRSVGPSRPSSRLDTNRRFSVLSRSPSPPIHTPRISPTVSNIVGHTSTRPRSFTVGTQPTPPQARRVDRGRSLDRGRVNSIKQRPYLQDHTSKRSSSQNATSRVTASPIRGLEGKSRAAFDPNDRFVGYGAWVPDREVSPITPPGTSPSFPQVKNQAKMIRSRSLSPSPSSPPVFAPATVPLSRSKRGRTARALSPAFNISPTVLRYGKRSPKPESPQPNTRTKLGRRMPGRTRANPLSWREPMRRRNSRSASPGRPVFIHSDTMTQSGHGRRRSRSRSPRRRPPPVLVVPHADDRQGRSRTRSPKRAGPFDSIQGRNQRVQRRAHVSSLVLEWGETSTFPQHRQLDRSSSPSPLPHNIPNAHVTELHARQGHIPRPGPRVIQPKPVSARPTTPLPGSILRLQQQRSGSASPRPVPRPMQGQYYISRSPSPLQHQYSWGESTAFSGTSTLVQQSPEESRMVPGEGDWLGNPEKVLEPQRIQGLGDDDMQKGMMSLKTGPTQGEDADSEDHRNVRLSVDVI